MTTAARRDVKLWTVPNFLSADESAGLIERAMAMGCAPAPITTRMGPVMNEDIRNNTRAMFDDLELSAMLFERAKAHVPAEIEGWQLSGVNERLRIYRYEPGQRFAMHRDGCFRRNEREESFLTFMVYLNEGFDGGETEFPYESRMIVPETGMALFFIHHLLHEGCTVTRGEKFALRTDVMYRRTTP